MRYRTPLTVMEHRRRAHRLRRRAGAVRDGLFEARVMCRDRVTGIRESVLTAKRMQSAPSDPTRTR